MSQVSQERTSSRAPTSKFAVAIASTVALALITTYSYFQWSTTPVEPETPSKINTKNSKYPVRADDDSESEDDDTPPPSPAFPQDRSSDSARQDFTFDELPSELQPCRMREIARRSIQPPPPNGSPQGFAASNSSATVVSHPNIETKEENEDMEEDEERPKLYREDAVRIFKGFAKNKRSKKGVSLKTALAIYDEAWSINKNPRDMVLPGRVIQHFKKTLPSKKDA